jgi:hypothetical protein
MPAPKKATSRAKQAKPRASTPSEIAPGVFVGGWNDAVGFEGARFCVLDEPPTELSGVTHVPIYDGATDRAIPENLERLAAAMRAAHARGERVLVFCGHGVRRGPLGGAWYLRRSEGLSLEEAYARVRTVRPKIEHPREWIGDASNLESA